VRLRFALAVVCPLLLACGGGPATIPSQQGSALIYGADQRREIFELDDELRQLALKSSVALMSTSSFVAGADGGLSLRAPSARELYNWCADEAFGEEPTAALCSGSIVATSLVVTAGHCATLLPCAEQTWVFGYALEAPHAGPELRSDDVYRCREVLAAKHETDAAGLRWDYAVIQLDRAVAPDKRPLVLGAALPAVRDSVQVMGYPAGLPLKVDGPAEVLSARSTRDYFTLDSDTFDRSSGSAVVDETGALVGIFVRGGQDYEFRDSESCWASRRLPAGVAAEPAEQASFVPPAVMEFVQLEPTRQHAGTAASSGARPSGCSIGNSSSKSEHWPSDHSAWPAVLLLAVAQARGAVRRRASRFVTSQCPRGHLSNRGSCGLSKATNRLSWRAPVRRGSP